MRTVVDSGISFALVNPVDPWHTRAVEWLNDEHPELVLPVTTLAEVAYFVRRDLGMAAEYQFAHTLADDPTSVEPMIPSDFPRVAELLRQYPIIGFVDATVITIAERLGIESIATTDRRHFATVRPRHVDHFTLVP